ncbi:MAG: ShlB/FhaC/HecB family hemolysin secretion/activation protein [Acidiferrobacteraceae bacterium]
MAALETLVDGEEGHYVTLAQLDALAHKISHYYHQHGYFLSYAYIPPQTLKHGTVHIAILEARYGKTTLQNTSRVDNHLLSATLGPVRPGALIARAPLDSRLMLMSALPGVIVAPATFQPGAAPGTSDLSVTTTAAPAVTGNVLVDNYGNGYTGREQLGGGLTVNSPLGIGDRLTFQGLTTGRNLDYGRMGYSVPLDGLGTRLGASYSYLHYRLGNALAGLNAHGSAWIGSLYISQAFYLTPASSFYGRMQLEHKGLNDNVGAANIVDTRHINAVRFMLYGNHRDRLLGGGITSYNASYTLGTLGFDNATAQAADAFTAHTQGHFSKWEMDLSRLQSVPLHTTLFLNFDGQLASTNLDSAEQFILGGAYVMPGYSEGIIAGGSGYVVTAELRHALPVPLPGRWQGQVFADHGYVTINQHLWAGFSGPNQANLTDVGSGVRWTYREINSSVVAAWGAGGNSLLANSGGWHVWWNIGRAF